MFSLLAAAVWGINSESPPSLKMVIISVWIFLTAKLQSFRFAAGRENASLIPSLVKWCLLTPTLDLVAFDIISLAFSKELASGQPLSRGVCAFISIFWGIRLLIQCFVFDAKPYLRTLVLKIGYHALTVVFAWHTLVYAFAALS
jgi:hypothetical protein